MTDSKIPAPLTPPPSSIQGRPAANTGSSVSAPATTSTSLQPKPAGSSGVLGKLPPAPPSGTSAVPPARPMGPATSSLPPRPVGLSQPPRVGIPSAPSGPGLGSSGGMNSGAGLPPKTNLPPILAKPASPAPANPNFPKAEVKQSVLRFVPLIVGGLLVLALAFFIFRFFFGGTTPATTPTTTAKNGTTTTTGNSSAPVTLTYWGLWEPTPILQSVLSDFESTHPGIKVNYQMQSYQDYRDRLQSSIAAGRGPDVFRFHATWTSMLQNELSAMPDTVFTPTTFQAAYYPAASQLLTLNGKIYGVPLMYDGLALYYNQDALRAANLQPPKTWAELKDDATKLTIRSGNKIQRAGLAIGNSTNVDHFSDILALLILQNGGNPADPTSQNAIDALTFYTNFVKTDQVWDSTFANSTTAFARGDVAMMFAPSWRVHDVKSMNPNLNFALTTVPQLTSNKVTWASFWAEGVSSQSKYKTQAWVLLQYLSSPDVLRKLYSSASQNRAFGELYPRKDMAAELATQPYANPYLSDAPYSQGWYMSSATHDNGVNDQIIKYYQDAVTAILGVSSPSDAAVTVKAGVAQIMRQYNVPGAGVATGAQTNGQVTAQ